jgi:NADH-quinone oxidoreductase subunit L
VTERAAAFAPLELPHGSTEFLLVGGAILIGVVGLVLGYRATLARKIPAAREAPEERGLARVLSRKYYVDEIYDAAIVHPTEAVSREGLWRGFDVKVVDGAVNGTASIVAGGAWMLRRLQTGSVRAYAGSVILGVVMVLGYYLWR